jgi:hypothetical protein
MNLSGVAQRHLDPANDARVSGGRPGCMPLKSVRSRKQAAFVSAWSRAV